MNLKSVLIPILTAVRSLIPAAARYLEDGSTPRLLEDGSTYRVTEG